MVLPGEPVPLHIFEPRYRQLVADSKPSADSEMYRPFGLPYSRQDKLNDIGCSVVIDEILHEYPSGELDIMGYGHQRFRLLELVDDSTAPYLEGRVEWLLEPESAVDPELREEVLALYGQFLRAVDVEDSSLDRDAAQLSFEIAYRVNLEKRPKLELLESESEARRLLMMRDYLKDAVPNIVEAKEFRRRVRSNGYFA